MSYHERIGRKFLNAGVGSGGSCFPKDTKALDYLARRHGYKLRTVRAAIEVNEDQKIRLYKKARRRLITFNGLKVAVLGLTFKPGTDDLREAPSLDNIPLLLEQGAQVYAICQEAKVKVKTLPGVYDLIDGKVSVKDIRDVDVEDLLGREPVSVDLESIAGYLEGSVVLVTGAGGSIGSELCRQIARFAPRLLILLDNYENSLYEIELELKHTHGTVPLEVQVVDIKDSQAVKGVFEAFRPGVVFHAAAHKHVPLMENNPVSAVKNNIIGTKNVVEGADRWGTGVFISISTDKAVNRTSVMGASKRVSEIIIQHYNTLSRTRFSAVRFGNVLASKGSVVPIFKRQIATGGPVTVTHPEMTRYFMTIPEAVQLVIQAGALAQGGEIFVLDMGEQVKIVDLARTLIKLSGFEPEKDIEIVYTGIRPGEKLYEELLTEKEGVDVTHHERIYVSKIDSYDVAVLEPILIKLSRKNLSMSDKEAIELLEALVPGYKKYSQEDQAQAMNG